MKPLTGLRIVVTRARRQSGSLAEQLEELGADVIEMPVIEIADPTSWDQLDQSLRLLAEGFFRWVVFTSGNSVEKMFERLDHARLDARAFGRSKVAAVGRTTAGLLAQHGIRADLVPPKFTAEAIAEALGRGSGRILLPRVEGAPRDVVDALSSSGWSVREVPAYRNLPAGRDSPGASAVATRRFDVVTFTSASTVSNFLAVAGTPEQLGLEARPAASASGHEQKGGGNRAVACIGPVTAAAAIEAGLRVDVVADEHSVPGLVRAIVDRFGSVAPLEP
ncbi:MAG TPA: uroporphyrinogen-III synthase [Actinomycetota bacterium]|nr:uroporphyrinogen-III synthase [Actinomycetota bacterium]